MASLSDRSFVDRVSQPFEVRSARVEDAAEMLSYIRSVAEETEFFVLEPDEFPATEELERGFIEAHLEHPDRLLLLAEVNGTIVGNLSFEAGPHRRIAHRGSLGISVARPWRGRGIGTALLQTLLAWSDQHPHIEKVCLDVFATNAKAIRLYQTLGFVEEGRKIRDVRRGADDYVDTIAMYRMSACEAKRS